MAISRFKGRVGRVGARTDASGIHLAYERGVQQSLKQVLMELNRFVDHVDDQSVEVLREALEPTFEKSQEYCPEDTGDLKRSGYLETRTFRGQAAVEIGYGKGGFPHYAALVHERTDFFHAPPTRAKFLQAALEEDAGNIQARIVSGFKVASGV